MNSEGAESHLYEFIYPADAPFCISFQFILLESSSYFTSRLPPSLFPPFCESSIESTYTDKTFSLSLLERSPVLKVLFRALEFKIGFAAENRFIEMIRIIP